MEKRKLVEIEEIEKIEREIDEKKKRMDWSRNNTERKWV